jgi:tripartite-type tricarboxylate transporter receptor subunit TctC
VAKAAADGYTILLGSGSTNVLAPAMLKNVPYDPNNDFTPLAFIGSAAFVLFTHPASKSSTLAEVVAAARANPGKLSFGTTGAGTVFELAALKLEALADVKFNHIPYKGLGALQIDVAAGLVDVAVGPINAFVRSDKFKVIATLGSKRAPEFPQVPSAAEAGFAALDVPVWAGMWAPPGTPRPVVAQLSSVIRKALASESAREAISAAGVQAEFGDDAMLGALVARQYDEIRALMRKAGIEPQ